MTAILARIPSVVKAPKFMHGVVKLAEQSFGLVIDEVAENLERVLLFDLFLLKQLCDLGDASPHLEHLLLSILKVVFELYDFDE